MGVAAVTQLDRNAGDGGPRNEQDAARLRGVAALFRGQDSLDRDAVRHLEFAREAGLVGVQSQPPFFGKDDHFHRLLVEVVVFPKEGRLALYSNEPGFTRELKRSEE